MALYVSIDEGYSVTKHTSIQALVELCASYTLQNGEAVTAKVVKRELKNGSVKVYDYDADDLEEAKANGSVRGVEWIYRIQAL
jgi:hypothetical protein